MDNHYATLGVPRTASAAEIRHAYRKLAIRNHPDRNSAPNAAELFKRVTEAYEILGDAERRRAYDIDLGLQLRRQQEKARKANPFPNAGAAAASRPQPSPSPTARVNLAEDLARLSVLFSRGRHQEAESLAHSILNVDSHQPLPYALLGDLARLDGRRRDAAKLYALAIQMDPGNDYYQRRYEEVLDEVPVADAKPGVRQIETPSGIRPPLWIALGVVLASSVYVAVSRDQPDFRKLGFISSWSLELVGLLFLNGIAIGASLVGARAIDRFAATSMSSDRTLTAAATVGLLALLNFWVATVVFAIQGVMRGAMPYTMLRAVGAGGAATLIFTLASSFAPLQTAQVFLWSGNVLYLGTIVGWVVSDEFR